MKCGASVLLATILVVAGPIYIYLGSGKINNTFCHSCAPFFNKSGTICISVNVTSITYPRYCYDTNSDGIGLILFGTLYIIIGISILFLNKNNV